MADTTVQASSMPYVYPRGVITNPVPLTEENTEKEGGEKESEHPETAIGTKKEDQGNKEEGGSPENDENGEEEDEDDESKKGTEKPLLDEDIVKIPINEGEDTPTLPLPDKKKKSLDQDIEKQQRDNLPVYLFPFTRIRRAWTHSSNIFSFLGSAVCIIFQTVGWFTCVGGIPFLSLVMLIIGSIYVDDCKIEPNIPVYLIVSGVLGTIQHVITIWTKYVPKESQGRLKVYRSYCHAINGLFHIFLTIWFIIGCVWVYGVASDVDFKDPEKLEYCNKTLYLFTFWIFNLSFILLGLLIVLSVCFLICMVATTEK